ncbi:sugar phosphate isomerase/epimerase [Pseudonocardia ailaonensis]|uniref:Sugar phosphate isomerase/epimerase n=1 Tax=Pseudonocardia ailaonensis TaxID=367279 RepID=A0ABN2NJ00_9PSEU
MASYFTLTGAHMAQPPRHPLEDRVRAAAEAGFTGIALSPAELALYGGAVGAVAAAVGGFPVPEIEPLKGWDSGGQGDEDAVFALAGTFGCRQVTTIQLVSDVPADLLAERFAGLCARAAEHGLVVGFEPRANSAVSTPAQAAALIEASGAGNAGIVLDAYHVHRAGVTLADLEPVAGLVASVQLNDMLAAPRPDPAEDALEFRLAPGAGAIDLPAWLAGLARLGIDVPLAVEIMCREVNALPVEEAAKCAAEGARAALTAARSC